MKKSFRSLILAVIAIAVLAGCGSSNIYLVKPTPIKKEQSKYYLQNVDLVLDHASKKEETRAIYLNQEELKKSFEKAINSELKEQGAYSENDLKLSVKMIYWRVFNIGQKKLNKPQFQYTIYVSDQNDTLLASYGIPWSTTKYSAFKDFSVNVQISAFQRDEKDEPEDIALIAKTLVKELREIGE